MEQVREEEQKRGIPEKPGKAFDEWSDTSSMQSKFNDAEFYVVRINMFMYSVGAELVLRLPAPIPQRESESGFG